MSCAPLAEDGPAAVAFHSQRVAPGDPWIGGSRRREHVALRHVALHQAPPRYVSDHHAEANFHARLLSEAHQTIAHVAGTLCGREELAGLRLELEREPYALLEERTLLCERPRKQDLPQRVGRRRGDELRRRQMRREHVAAPSAADQDLAAAVRRPLEQHDPTRAGRRVDRRDEPCRARADHDDGRGGLRPGRVRSRHGGQICLRGTLNQKTSTRGTFHR